MTDVERDLAVVLLMSHFIEYDEVHSLAYAHQLFTCCLLVAIGGIFQSMIRCLLFLD